MLESDPEHYTGGGFTWADNFDMAKGAPTKPVAIQIVEVPERVATQHSAPVFRGLAIGLTAVSLLTLVILDLAIWMVVIRPVTSMSAWADDVSKGKLSRGELPVRGGDEIADLTESFNRLYLSFAKVITMLKQHR